jgi:hypothetical protein
MAFDDLGELAGRADQNPLAQIQAKLQAKRHNHESDKARAER